MGHSVPGEQFELGRVQMELNPHAPMENFTFDFTHDGDNSCVMHIQWASADASVRITEKK